MKLTIKNNKLLKSTKTKKTRNTRKASKINKETNIATKISDEKSLLLDTIANLNTEHIKQLTKIYNAHGSRNRLTEKEIKQFVIDEKIQNAKPDIHRTYYSYCVMYNNILVGYIIGKKTPLLLSKYLGSDVKPNKFDLLFSIGLDEKYKNKGIGTRAIELFIKMYAKRINQLGSYAKDAKLYADIASTNIASMRAFKKNQFHYSHEIKISGNPYKRYSRAVFPSK